MQSYDRVRMFHIELAIENQLGEGHEANELVEMCEAEMRKHPSPFFHCASMLHSTGNSEIVWEAISLAYDA